MKRNDQAKIDILSAIDDEIVERNSIKRYWLIKRLENAPKRRKIWAFSSVAACLLAVLIGVFVILEAFVKQVPIYTGMTVSNTPNSAQLSADMVDVMHERLLLSNGVLLDVAKDKENGNGNGNAHGHDKNRLPDSSDLIGENRSLYYAHKNEDIYITVHINNPDQYEILSFTLNGQKYQSYMFEEGSNSEKLILKVNVGEVEGMIDFTIDAIKYVDETEIKDVRMDGDRTVRVGVYPESQPSVDLENLDIDYTEISFELLLTDTLSLIEQSGGRLSVELYCGDECVSKQFPASSDTAQVRFSDLTAGMSYRLRVIAEYDALDGSGFGAYLLLEKTLCAKSAIEITDVSLDSNANLSFDLNISTTENVTIQKIELQIGDMVEQTVNSDVRVFTGVFLGEHVIRVVYTYGEDSKTGYAYSDPVMVLTIGSINHLVKAGNVSKQYYKDLQVYNKTTQDYRVHLGIDICPTTSDTGVYAAFSGKVKEVSSGTVVLASFDGSIEIRYESLGSVDVAKDDIVTGGQKLGVVGTTLDYESAEMAHVHIELWLNGERVNPMLYFKQG